MAALRSILLACGIALVICGSSASAATPASWYRFAPFVDFSIAPPPDFAAIRSAGGVRAVTLGFVVAKGGKACRPTVGGYDTYAASGRRPYMIKQIRAFKASGGAVVPSFGGQAGTELARACKSVSALTAAYAKVIRAYGASHVDFDIEGGTLGKRAVNNRRNKAIARLQRRARKRGSRLQVAFTLPVLPDGLESDGLALLRNAKRNGVRVDLVNIMTMDYGDGAAPNPSGQMGRYAILAGTSTLRQLKSLYPALSPAARARRLGVTPMIGVNDTRSEVFTVADAQQVVAWAAGLHIGMLSMWELYRDRQCAKPTVVTQVNCSSVNQAPWAFSLAFGAFGG